MESDQNTSLFQLNLDAQNSYTLRSAATWAKVLGVASLILAVLFIIFGIMIQQRINSYGDGLGRYKGSGLTTGDFAAGGLVVYVICGLVYGIAGFFALNAGNKINTGLKTNNMEVLNAGFAGARNFFALWAILVILMVTLLLISLTTVM